MSLPKRNLIFSLLCLSLFGISACSNSDKLPAKVLPVQKMGAVMLDFQLAKSYNYAYPSGRDTAYPSDQNKRLQLLYEQILQLHKVDTATFFKSFRFYTRHPDWLKKLYKNMEDSVDHKLAYFRKIEEDQFKNREGERQNTIPSTALEKFLFTWHAFSDSIHRQNSRAHYPGSEKATD